MQFRYVPFLRPKRGERVALLNLSATARQDVVPLFLLTPDRYVGNAATAHHPAVSPPNHFVQEIEQSWGTARFYLDASQLPHSGGQHPLVQIANRARTRNIELVPAMRMSGTPQYMQAVATVVAADNRGVALITGMQGFTSASHWIGAWPHALNETDLIVDVGSNPTAVQSIGTPLLTQAFATLHQGTAWRSVTLAGTSMPDNFQGFLAGTRTIQRTEWALWQILTGNGLPYRLDYGDYTTVPLNPPPEGIRWGYPINVRYTLDNEFLICRGVGTTASALSIWINSCSVMPSRS